MLEVRQLCKSYGGRQVLAPASFVLPPGQCLGLAGSNGSGKSTLLRLLAQIQIGRASCRERVCWIV